MRNAHFYFDGKTTKWRLKEEKSSGENRLSSHKPVDQLGFALPAGGV
jgi:hypothetical protein